MLKGRRGRTLSPPAGGPAGGVSLVLGLAALLAVSSCRSTAPGPPERPRACGLYRWRVKTLSDSDAERVRMEPVDMTIRDLVRLPRSRREAHGTRRPSKLQAYRVRGLLLAVHSRRDQDVHLLLSDASDPKSRSRNGLELHPVLRLTEIQSDAVSRPQTGT